MISIEVKKNDTIELLELHSDYPDQIFEVKVDKFDGISDCSQIIVILSPIIISAIVSILKEKIRSKKHIKLKHKGTEIKGVSEDNVESILKNLLLSENINDSE